MRNHFYHSTTRSYIVAFATLFDEVKCRTDGGDLTPVPLHYAPRQKWLATLDANADLDNENMVTLPRMAFEMTGLNYAPERHTNPVEMIRQNGSNLSTFNRVAYDFSFTLYVATKEFDDALEIMEQIAPMFTPDFTVAVNENVGGIAVKTNLSVVLNSSSFDIDYLGALSDGTRRIEWSMTFTLKGFLYQNVSTVQRIKKAVVDTYITPKDIPFITSTSEVVPKPANEGDPHVIVDTVVDRT